MFNEAVGASRQLLFTVLAVIQFVLVVVAWRVLPDVAYLVGETPVFDKRACRVRKQAPPALYVAIEAIDSARRHARGTDADEESSGGLKASDWSGTSSGGSAEAYDRSKSTVCGCCQPHTPLKQRTLAGMVFSVPFVSELVFFTAVSFAARFYVGSIKVQLQEMGDADTNFTWTKVCEKGGGEGCDIGVWRVGQPMTSGV